MISIADALEDILKSYPLIEEGLTKGIINYSAFAREIKPLIEKKLYKNIKVGAVVMALKRISQGLPKTIPQHKLNLNDLTVRSNLSEYTYLNSPTLPNQTNQLFIKSSEEKDIFCNFSEGTRETTFVVSPSLIKTLEDLFKEEKLVVKIPNLSSITIMLPKEVVYIPGVYYQILKMLAWENVNVIEVLSAYTELTIVVGSKDIDKAFSILLTIS